MDMAYGLSDS